MNFPPPTEKQARLLWTALTALAVGVLAGLVGLVFWGLAIAVQRLSSVLFPLAIAAIIAFLLDPVVDHLERRGVHRGRAIICVFAMAALIVAALIGSVAPQIVEETRQLAERIPAYSMRLQQRILSWATHPPVHLQRLLNLTGHSPTPAPATNPPPATFDLPATNAAPNSATGPNWSQKIDPAALQSVTSWLATALPKVGTWLFGQVSRVASWFGVLAGLVLIPVYAFYFLLEKRGIENNWTAYLPVANSKLKDELIFVLSSINDCLIAFFRGQVLVAICDGVLYTIGFFCVGLPYAFLLGAMATVLTMIPFLGAIVTCITAVIIASVQFGDWTHPALVLGVFGVVQLSESLIISPRIMGNRVGLHPLTIIIAVMVGTTLMGNILGGLLAIPLTAALRALMFRYVWRKRGRP